MGAVVHEVTCLPPSPPSSLSPYIVDPLRAMRCPPETADRVTIIHEASDVVNTARQSGGPTTHSYNHHLMPSPF